MKFTLKRVSEYRHPSGMLFRKVWVLSRGGKDVLVATEFRDIADAITATGGAA